MNKTPLKQGVVNQPALGAGAVSRGMLRARAVELAIINGHSAGETTKSDWEQAKREMKIETETDPKEALLEAAPESERWDPLPGSSGHQVPEPPAEDENEEGLTEIDQLVGEGVEAAESEQTLKAALDTNKKLRRES